MSDTLRLAQQHLDQALALAPQNELADFAAKLLLALSGDSAVDMLQDLARHANRNGEGQARTIILGAAVAIMQHVEKRDTMVRSN